MSNILAKAARPRAKIFDMVTLKQAKIFDTVTLKQAKNLKRWFTMRDANSGYFGYSMSKRACEAYENGEKPLSKWKKQEILNQVLVCYGADIAEAVKSWNLSSLKRVFLYKSSWHHTSKYFNVTDFYSFDEDLLTSAADLWEKHEAKKGINFSAKGHNKNFEIEHCYKIHNKEAEKNALFKEYKQVELDALYALNCAADREITEFEHEQKKNFLLKLSGKIDSLPFGETVLKSGDKVRKDLTCNGKICVYLNKKAIINIYNGKVKTFIQNL